MSDFNNLIHDARQIDLEEAIKMNETPMHLVPGRLTDEQRMVAYGAPYQPDRNGSAIEATIAAIGTPIQPCADVETVGYGREASFSDLKNPACHGVSIHKEWDGGIPLVRRTDMEAQVARVKAEKDAEIARLKGALSEIASREIGDCPAPTQAHIEQLEWDIEWSQRKARAALNEGAAG
ncbi:hypothetical protein [Komagataeibacter sp. FNDCF1]|uniref:hypothetical protein n=1 Tax=Komagataeibacter sp. FNDCF1 TaxID=2878681 RepID=UPI001E5F3435|nr:hypothetical protein [Komagataeibacter sp. FNDCF1]MCE2563344.1 hypothetical protein [Komagataeibacter sp. FNDCF1]